MWGYKILGKNKMLFDVSVGMRKSVIVRNTTMQKERKHNKVEQITAYFYIPIADIRPYTV